MWARSTAALSLTIAAIFPTAALYRTEPIIALVALVACATLAHVFSTADHQRLIYSQHHIEASLPEFFLTFSFFRIHHAVGSLLY
jgi:hypothetical protein